MSSLSPEDRGDLFHRVLFGAAVMNGTRTYGEFAQVAGVKRNAVGAWWRGATPDTANLPGIAQATGYSVTELLNFLHGDGSIPHPPEPRELAARIRAASAERSRLARPEAEESGARRAPRTIAGSAD